MGCITGCRTLSDYDQGMAGSRRQRPELHLRGVSGPAAAGLTRGEVVSRLSNGLGNLAPDATSRSLWEIVRANVLTLFNAIVGTSFVLLLLLGRWQDALFGLSAVGNAVIGVVQEYRAKRSLDRLAVLEAPLTRVLRDGKIQEIPTADVVLDDVLVLRPGDQVTADASVLESSGLEADESLLTGESDPVGRDVGTEVLSGSIIVAGRGTARVVRVGAESFASRLTADAKRFSLVNSEIRNSLNRILRWLSWVLLPVALIVANGEMQSRGGWEQAIASGAWTSALVGVIASVIAMVPLGLVLLSSVAFAVGGVRLAANKVLIQELAAVEGLARVDVLCLDKTGTLTEGRIVFDGVHELTQPAEPGWEHALGWFAADPEANATTHCLGTAFAYNGTDEAVSSVPFSSARKWSSVAFDGGGGTRPGTWILGAPEIVLGAGPDGNAGAESPAAAALGKASQLATSGLRTVVLAFADGIPITADTATLPSALRPVVVLTFREQIRPDARRTLAYFREEGLELKIFSGDDPRTVAAIARNVGLHVEGGYDARTLPDDPQLLEEVLAANTVFGRVSPAQKREMVAALQRRGHTVAMTGDGVNDVLALKEADLGIAMNTAAPATKAVARLVLLDGRFDRLPGVMAEGRRVIANVERVSKVFLSKTAYAIAIAVSFGLLNLQFPFLPRQLSFTDGLTIGIPCFFLALMANTRRYQPGFLRRSLFFAVPAGLIVAACLLGLNLYANSGTPASTGPDSLQSASVLILALLGLWILAIVSRPLESKKLAVILAMCVTLVILVNVPLAQDFFKLTFPSTEMLWAAGLSTVGGVLGLEILARVHGNAFPR